ncbi:Mitochondrial fission protein, partial [Coemansia sp. BCRC 34301]
THKRPTPLALDTLCSTPAIGTTPSLLSGFNSFLDHNHEDENDGDKKDEADAVEGLAQSASEFSAMLRDTPADMMAEVLGERRKEYSEYLWRLERARLAAQQRVHEIDARILQAVGERQAIEGQIQAMEIGTEEMETEDDSSCEMDNAPRLRKLTRSLVGHYSGITALDHDPDQGLVASGSLDTQARVWDASTGTCKYVVGGHSDAVRGVQFHSGFLLTASNDARIRMWDLSMLDSVQPQPGDSTTPPVTPTICRRVAPVDLCCETTFAGHQDAVTCFQAHDGTLVSGSADRTVRVWDLATGHERQTIDLAWGMRAVPVGDAYGLGTSLGDAGFVGALQFFGCALATGTADGILRLWDLRTAQAHRQLAGHAQPITALGFDDRHVVSGSLDRSVRLWDLRMGR